MLNLLHAFIEKLTLAKTVKQADLYLKDFLLTDCAFKNFAYTGYAKDFRTSHQLTHQLYTPGIAAWHHYYVAQGFEHIDPIGALLRARNTPFIWHNTQLLKEVATHQKIIYEESLKLGFYNGISIPVHGEQNNFAILVIQKNDVDDWLARSPGILYTLQIAAIYYYDTISTIMKIDLAEQLVEALTARELECLATSADGLTAKEVAEKLNITPRTVSFHLENARQKLGMRNTAQATFKAKELGLIA